MRPIIFVRVADMKYYQGITENDQPSNGGSYVKDTGNAHECFNFQSIIEDGETFSKCLGFFMMTGGHGAEQLHIENIVGCDALRKAESVDGVTVVFVSKAMNSRTMRVVGFYKNAIVYRYPRCMEFDNGYVQEYQFEAKEEDCILLPYKERFSNSSWYVPASNSKISDFGFGRSHIWYAGGKGASEKEIVYVEKMLHAINSYKGDN